VCGVVFFSPLQGPVPHPTTGSGHAAHAIGLIPSWFHAESVGLAVFGHYSSICTL
jgi:hypothetical protein